GVGAAGIEPHVENVDDPLVVGDVVVRAEQVLRSIVGPGIDALGLYGRDDAGVDLGIDQVLAGLALDEQGDRHAPRALAAEHPVGAPLDHRTDAVAALLGDEAGFGERFERQPTQGRAVRRLAALAFPALVGADLRLG